MNKSDFKIQLGIIVLLHVVFHVKSQDKNRAHIYDIADGYAKSHVNATIFRKNSISTYKDHQYVAFYDSDANVILAKRKLGSASWEMNKTQYGGDVTDAHNVICIMHDGEGYLHMAWDHHNDPIRYAISAKPESIEMGDKQSMTGKHENKVTYPEFYKMVNGDLIFLYRDGSSGNGNLIMNRYLLKQKTWERVQDNLVDGEGERNAYWQMCLDKQGTFHLSWVWRETGDVATNHDMCYARSIDSGKSWETSKGKKYNMPINEKSAEYVMKIPQNSNLINQTSMTTDDAGKPYIATYFKDATDASTQFKVIYTSEGNWKVSTVSKRKSNFVLGGFGSRSVPISRPQVLFEEKDVGGKLHLVYRDEELGNKVCLASATVSDNMSWEIKTLNDHSMSRWEPSYDIELWKNKQKLHVYFQVTAQGDSETILNMPPTNVGVMEIMLD